MKPLPLHLQVGQSAEIKARAAYEARGGFVLATNYRLKGGEIDLIVEEPRSSGQIELVFVEVRYRDQTGWVSGLESVTQQKRRKIERTAQHFLMFYLGKANSMRFDVFEVNATEAKIIESAWS